MNVLICISEITFIIKHVIVLLSLTILFNHCACRILILFLKYCGGKFVLIVFDLMKVTCVIIKFVFFVLCVNNLLSSMFKFSTKSRISNQVMLSISYWVLWSSKNHIWESFIFTFNTFDLIKFYIAFKHHVCLSHLILQLSFIAFDD